MGYGSVWATRQQSPCTNQELAHVTGLQCSHPVHCKISFPLYGCYDDANGLLPGNFRATFLDS